ncbi:MAG: hypothetical protein OEV74_12580 [Cyclobacteriaceae bacterium]|nr:hypothetical protein [Cyclobacteriaceae bacterium]MDH4297113.1 hypothetical protein [Cyclobacteriaceae bacterium]MDH5251431.1 hypothetical protein [Cyclobacteriaceae bacterium]
MNQFFPLQDLYHEDIYMLRPKVLVILSRNWDEISTADQSLLEKIMGSVKLSLAAVQIITLQEFDLADLVAYKPRQIITFGAGIKGIPTQYELLVFHGISIIQADPLDQLNEAKKKSLWGALKQMFSV